jgi:hypothetical protein
VNSDLPTSLTRFGEELERAIRRELTAPAVTTAATARPSRRPRVRLAARSVLVLVIAAAAVLAVLSRLTPTAAQSAWARQVVARAAAVALAPAHSSRTILHIAVTETLSPQAQRGSATTTAALSEEGWIQQGPPWNQRLLVHPAGGPVYEEGENAGRIYNVTTNEVYPGISTPTGKPKYTLRRGAKPGTYRLRAKLPHGFETSTITAGDAKLVRDGTDQVSWAITWNGHVQRLQALVLPSARSLKSGPSLSLPNPSSLSFARQLRALLFSGHARVSRVTTDDGKPAIEIASVHPLDGPRTIYYVDPTTYAPIELDTYGFDNPKDVTRARFSVYQSLALAGHRNLLRVTIPRSARIDRTPADYWRAAGQPLFF